MVAQSENPKAAGLHMRAIQKGGRKGHQMLRQGFPSFRQAGTQAAQAGRWAGNATWAWHLPGQLACV